MTSDASGVPHAHQLAAYLDPEEVHCLADVRLLRHCFSILTLISRLQHTRKFLSTLEELNYSSGRFVSCWWYSCCRGKDPPPVIDVADPPPASCCAKVRMLLPRKPLKPRTFRIAPGQVRQSSGEYLTLLGSCLWVRCLL